MAYPLDVQPDLILAPPARPVIVRARITNPAAVEHDSYLGGLAVGYRLVYTNAMQFVWWWTTS